MLLRCRLSHKPNTVALNMWHKNPVSCTCVATRMHTQTHSLPRYNIGDALWGGPSVRWLDPVAGAKVLLSLRLGVAVQERCQSESQVWHRMGACKSGIICKLFDLLTMFKLVTHGCLICTFVGYFLLTVMDSIHLHCHPFRSAAGTVIHTCAYTCMCTYTVRLTQDWIVQILGR